MAIDPPTTTSDDLVSTQPAPTVVVVRSGSPARDPADIVANPAPMPKWSPVEAPAAQASRAARTGRTTGRGGVGSHDRLQTKRL